MNSTGKRLSTPADIRFWRFVDVGGADECWEWTGCRSPTGYGRFGGGKRSDSCQAHRFAYEDKIGPISSGLVVMHRCDNRACVNPAHLDLGTQAANLADMSTKGRARKARGEAAGKAKLNEDAVRDIRGRSASGEKHPSIARDYGVSISAVWAIAHRKHWAHVTD